MERQPLRDTDVLVRDAGSAFPDENARAASSFEELANAFSQRITELQQLMCLRIEGASPASPTRGLGVLRRGRARPWRRAAPTRCTAT
jgi:hypothetical protein